MNLTEQQRLDALKMRLDQISAAHSAIKPLALPVLRITMTHGARIETDQYSWQN